MPVPTFIATLTVANGISLQKSSAINLGVKNNKVPAIESPLTNWSIIETPRMNIQKEINDIMNQITDLRLQTALPDQVGDKGIQAARLIVIRRKKMKKHKRRKLYKRMKYEWAKVSKVFFSRCFS